MSSALQHWTEQARYDLDTARALFKSGRYLYVLFCCQQAVEKALKAIIAARTKGLPPPIHQLMRLAEAAGLEVSGECAEFLRELSSYYIQTHYPEEIKDLASQAKEEEARRVLDHTEEVLQWLNSML
jgi:HEPN domain-containing protein